MRKKTIPALLCIFMTLALSARGAPNGKGSDVGSTTWTIGSPNGGFAIRLAKRTGK